MSTEPTIQAYKQEAVAAYRDKNFALSAMKFAQAFQLDNSDIEALINWAVALKNNGQIDEAIQKLLLSVEKQPNNLLARYNLGNCFLAK